jgi:type VI secretion system protein ImpJ
MSDAHELPEVIQWHEGMLLAPQHFQQLALRQEELLCYHAMLMAPFHWGTRRLKIDPGLLVNGTLRVLELEAVMPDNLVVSLMPDQQDELEVNLTRYVEELKQTSWTIHLAVPAKRPGALGSVKGELARYESLEGDPIADENTGDGEMRIPRLRPCISLLAAETPPKKYVSFPLLNVTYSNETYSLTEYIAPTLMVPVESPIGEICSMVIRRLREKAVFLSEKVRSSASVLEMPQILELRAMIQSLVAALPSLEANLYTGVSHPYALYLALCNIVGHLAALGRLVPPVPVPYDHNDLRFTFEQVKEFIFSMIDEGILESYTAIPFHFENGVFKLTFQEGWSSMPLVLGVRRKPGRPERDVLAWMEESLIGSVNKIQSMREKRILGAARKRMIEKDEELVAVSGMVFFSLSEDPEFIETNEVLQILNTGDPTGARRPAEIVLYVRDKA